MKKIIPILLVISLFFISGCIDFAQTKSSFIDNHPRIQKNDGGRTVITITGMPADQAAQIIKSIMDNEKENNKE